MSEMLLTHRGVVYPWQCDHMGHLNVMHYAAKFDEATWQMFAAIGLTPTHLRQNGLVVAAVRQETTYRRELLPGDILTIHTAILEMRSQRIRFYHEMLNDESGEVAAATVIIGVLVDAQTRKATTFPTEIEKRGKDLVTRVTLLV
jgi:acyl-CoA thioester hydrolase